MSSFRERTRFATLVAVGLALLVSGIVAGAAGGNFILGAANSAGTSNSSLTTSSSGTALLVTQNGTGTAVRGSTGTGSGIAGLFTSGSGSGVSGVVANRDGYGIYAANDSVIGGGKGAAMRVDGKQNVGLVATSDSYDAMIAIVTACAFTGEGCGGNGLTAKGFGGGAGVLAYGKDSWAGVAAYEGDFAAVAANQSGANHYGVYGSSSAGSGVFGRGMGAAQETDCTDWYCAGVVASGDNGVLANTATQEGAAVVAVDSTPDGSAFSLLAYGDAVVTGDFTVTGTCTGCAAATMAVNGSSATLNQGDAVALAGVRTAPDGSIVIAVRAARKGDHVIGIVDRQLALSGKTVKVPAGQRKVWDIKVGQHTVRTPARELKAQAQKWLTGGTKVAAGAYLRIVTSGVFAMDASVAGAAAGDSLAVGDTSGRLGKAGGNAARGTVAGTFLGKLKDGRTVLLVGPS